MITTSDYSYIDTKKVLLNRKEHEKVNQILINYFLDMYKVNPANIVIEIEDYPTKMFRIQIVFKDSTSDVDKMFDTFNSESIRKTICDKYVSILESMPYNMEYRKKLKKLNEQDRHFFCIFSYFKRVYIQDVVNKIKGSDLKEVSFKYNLWQINRVFGGIHCFYFNDSDINLESNNMIIEELNELFRKSNEHQHLFNELKPYIKFSSKQELDAKYAGNLFFYFKDN